MKPGLSRHSPDAVEPKPGQVEHIPTGTSVDIGRRPTGTREWSEHSANIYNGCGHNCRYCYAREMALRFKRKKLPADWPRMELIEKELTKRRRKLKGRIMFPTTHDITPETIEPCIQVLKNLLEAGNEVLIVSKPHLECVEQIMDELGGFRQQIVFRFTIGCMEESIRAFWEPNAPTIDERLATLQLAYERGWATSVSAEPMLDPFDVDRLVERCLPFVTDTMWIGLMNRIDQRVRLESRKELEGVLKQREELLYAKALIEDGGVTADLADGALVLAKKFAELQAKLNTLDIRLPDLREAAARDQAQVDRLLRGQAKPVIHDIYLRWRIEPNIRWKDSIQELLHLRRDI